MLASNVKYKQHAKEYVKNGFNATKMVKAVNPKVKGGYANIKGYRMIRNDNFNSALVEVMAEKGLDNDFTTKILKRNIDQQENIAGSNSGLDMFYKVTGAYAPEKKQNLNINVDLTDEGAVKQRLHEISKELNRRRATTRA